MTIKNTLARTFLPRSFYERLLARRHITWAERLGLIQPPWHAYGIIRGAQAAKKVGYDAITIAEFGVANGRGLRQMLKIASLVTERTGVYINVLGFDAGQGLPPPTDYRDHPEIFMEGDYPMQDQEALLADLKGKAEIYIGDIRNIYASQVFTSDAPLGYASIDVDYYSSAKSALNLFRSDVELFTPRFPIYFDDVYTRWEYNRYCGELLAIEEFNSENSTRKIDVDRSIEYWHRERRSWHAGVYTFQILDHPRRNLSDRHEPEILKGRDT